MPASPNTRLPKFAPPSRSPLDRASVRAHAAFLIAASVLALTACDRSIYADTPVASPRPATPAVAATSKIEAGRYLIQIGGCNDCHTPGYVETNGAKPAEADWLMGASTGFSGPWGVSYPANLRLSFQTMSEQDFIDLARAGQGRPPMPWPSLMHMSDQDLSAIYAYVIDLGPKGQPAPAPVSPGVEPATPHIPFVPVMPKAS